QLGCCAFDDSIHVSAHPVAPCEGIVSATGTFALVRLPVCSGHAAPITASPLLNSSTSSAAALQYFLIRGRCCLSRFTAAFSCASVSSYGSVMPRLGCVFDRYSAASAIWIGLFGTVTVPLYLGS